MPNLATCSLTGQWPVRNDVILASPCRCALWFSLACIQVMFFYRVFACSKPSPPGFGLLWQLKMDCFFMTLTVLMGVQIYSAVDRFRQNSSRASSSALSIPTGCPRTYMKVTSTWLILVNRKCLYAIKHSFS